MSLRQKESILWALSGELGAKGKIGWGPFSLSAEFKASYSSKKDSKATQNSEYSVEYTQDVRVHASQAGMPAGLATVLNILSNSAGEGSRDGTLNISPRFGTVDVSDAEAKQSLTVTVVDANGLRCPGVQVTFDNIPDFVEYGLAPFGQPAQTFETDENGTVSLLLWIPENKRQDAETAPPFQITVKATPTGSRAEKTANFPVRILKPTQ